jgi:hypothetical protein
MAREQHREMIPNPWRVLLGIFAAAFVPAMLYPNDFTTLAGLGLLSVVTIYLPLVRWLLPKTRQRLVACMALGAVAAPGPMGYTVAIAGLWLPEGGSGLWAFVFLSTAHLGLLGGLAFWLCVIWKIEEIEAVPS